jgi:hypothetical protein
VACRELRTVVNESEMTLICVLGFIYTKSAMVVMYLFSLALACTKPNNPCSTILIYCSYTGHDLERTKTENDQ